eukprot:TRINITY_DN633_c3_g1_i1.p1 TRINITY_DN633_c3_g1~~TRINITY_DN633_c3_g1_i1.p1  ORF type:complete len:511 (+),score=122.59 TRINITY_DN633_c3_g1_i1:61-1593(+)
MLSGRRLLASAIGSTGYGSVPLQDIARLGAAELGRAARRSLSEGDFGEERWKTYSARASELADQLTLDESARLASSFSTARLLDFQLFSRLSARALECLPSPESSEPSSSSTSKDGSSPFGEDAPQKHASATDLRRLALAFGRAQAFDSELMEALVPLIAERVEGFRPRELVHIVDAFARIPVQTPELFALVAEALPSYLYDLEPSELASLCRSFAEAAVYNEELIDALSIEASRRVRSFGALECLVFLDSLSRLHAGLPEDMHAIRRKNDTSTINALAEQLAGSASVLSAPDLVRAFAALVRLDHYDPKLIHQRICPALALKLGQLAQAPGITAFARTPQSAAGFGGLAELLHCLSLLPAQSQKSAELAMATARYLVEILEETLAEDPVRQQKVSSSLGRIPDPRSLALATAALAQLAQDGAEDEELLSLLASAVIGKQTTGQSLNNEGAQSTNAAPASNSTTLLFLASEEELEDLQRAFSLCKSKGPAEAASAAVAAELSRRSQQVEE